MSARIEVPSAEDRPYVVLIGGKLFGYGETKAAAMRSFRRQIAGASPAMQRNMFDRSVLVPIDDDHASDVAEMLSAERITWL